VGAKRVLGNHDADAVRPKSNPLITVRFVVGLAF